MHWNPSPPTAVMTKEFMKIGASVLPKFPKDSTDRNRTSPFAFTGNKFEFRMPGSNLSVSSPNIMLNAAVADVLQEFADALEGEEDLYEAVHDLVKTRSTTTSGSSSTATAMMTPGSRKPNPGVC